MWILHAFTIEILVIVNVFVAMVLFHFVVLEVGKQCSFMLGFVCKRWFEERKKFIESLSDPEAVDSAKRREQNFN